MVHRLLSRVRARPGDRPRSRPPDHRLRPAVEGCEVRLLLSGPNGGPDSPLTVSPASVVENPDGTTQILFQVTVPFSIEGTDLTYFTTDGAPGCAPAVSGRDYVGVPQSNPQTLAFGVGETTKTIPITVLGNYRLGPTRCFTLHVALPGTQLAQTAVGSILNQNSTVVTNTNPTGFGSLYGAIRSSNETPGPHEISFNVKASGPVTIPITTPLPPLTNPATIGLDATTQPGTAPLPRVVIDGTKAGIGVSGLTVLGGRTTVRGLGVRGFSGAGIVLDSAGNDTIDGNQIVGTGQAGIAVRQGTGSDRVTNNLIENTGGPGVRVVGSTGNLLSGNTVLDAGLSGILLQGVSSRNVLTKNTVLGARESGIRLDDGQANVVTGNTIGRPGLGNGADGVTVVNASGTVIGGTTPGAGNVIMANALVGVRLACPPAVGNVVEGNTIGAAAGAAQGTGSAANAGTAGPTGEGNMQGGVFIDLASGNTIGGTVPGARNVIAGNGGAGIQITGGGSNAVLGNFIGVDPTGNAAVGNALDGVFLDGSPLNTIGGAQAGAFNLISGNGYVGVRVSGPASAGNTVAGNLIGTNAAGTGAIGNTYDGVFVDLGANHNLFGGASPGAGNLISGNHAVGLQIAGPTTTANVLAGNLIGTSFGGLAAVPNLSDGVFVNNAPGNIVGLADAGNLVSGNVGSGLQLLGPGSSGNLVQSNRIGLDSLGRPVLGNAVGIFINAAGANAFGAGPTANVVAGNRTGQTVSNVRGVPGSVPTGPASRSRRVGTRLG